MKQPTYLLENGTRIRTHDTLGTMKGLRVDGATLGARKPNILAVISGAVGGHGGDVYWVTHVEDGVCTAYCFDEFELEPEVIEILVTV